MPELGFIGRRFPTVHDVEPLLVRNGVKRLFAGELEELRGEFREIDLAAALQKFIKENRPATRLVVTRQARRDKSEREEK